MYSKIQKLAQKEAAEILKNRRALHKIPELALQEHKTQAYLKAILTSYGYSIIDGDRVTGHQTGVIAELKNGDGPVTALRFDMDGLAVTESCEQTHVPFEEHFPSEIEGHMHACGHDGHMAIGLGVSHLLLQIKDQLKGTIRLIFQPGEEGCKGAQLITDLGWLDDVEYFLAGHIVGREYTDDLAFDLIPGVTSSLATTKMDVTIHGKSCHAACPENGANAISALATAITGLNGIPRNSQGATRINIGKVYAGEGRNIIAQEAHLEMETRGEKTDLNLYMEEQAVNILQHAAALHACTVSIDILGRAPSLVSDPSLRELIIETMENMEHAPSCYKKPTVFRASEDAAIMMDRVREHRGKPAFLLFTTETKAPLHHPSYDFDEDILVKAVAAITAVVFRLNS